MAHTISYDRLLDYAEGRLGEAERDMLAKQLLANPTAAAEVAELQRLFALMHTDDSADAPAHLISRASRLLRQRKASKPQAPGLLRRMVAALTFDSASSLALGMRSGAGQSRQMLFTADGIDLDVRVMTNGDEVSVSGQVLGPDASGSAVLSNSAISVTVLLNEQGEFVLPALSVGRYILTLHYGDTEIVVPELVLGVTSR